MTIWTNKLECPSFANTFLSVHYISDQKMKVLPKQERSSLFVRRINDGGKRFIILTTDPRFSMEPSSKKRLTGKKHLIHSNNKMSYNIILFY